MCGNCNKSPCVCVAENCDKCLSSPAGAQASSGSYTGHAFMGYAYADYRFIMLVSELAPEPYRLTVRIALGLTLGLPLLCFPISNQLTYVDLERKKSGRNAVTENKSARTDQRTPFLALPDSSEQGPSDIQMSITSSDEVKAEEKGYRCCRLSFWREPIDRGAALGKSLAVYVGASLFLSIFFAPEVALTIPILFIILNCRSQMNLFRSRQDNNTQQPPPPAPHM